MVSIVKNTRTETTETRTGRLRERIVTTWDVVSDGELLSEWATKLEAHNAAAATGQPVYSVPASRASVASRAGRRQAAERRAVEVSK